MEPNSALITNMNVMLGTETILCITTIKLKDFILLSQSIAAHEKKNCFGGGGD